MPRGWSKIVEVNIFERRISVYTTKVSFRLGVRRCRKEETINTQWSVRRHKTLLCVCCTEHSHWEDLQNIFYDLTLLHTNINQLSLRILPSVDLVPTHLHRLQRDIRRIYTQTVERTRTRQTYAYTILDVPYLCLPIYVRHTYQQHGLTVPHVRWLPNLELLLLWGYSSHWSRYSPYIKPLSSRVKDIVSAGDSTTRATHSYLRWTYS